MGYTLAAALNRLGAKSRVVVAELVPAVVAWNRGPLAALAAHPLDDDRVTVRECDVAQILQTEHGTYDAILLDVDNGPRGLTRKNNDWLYTRAGLDAAFSALRPAGIFALWSASPNRAFSRLLGKAGFVVDEKRVRARGPLGEDTTRFGSPVAAPDPSRCDEETCRPKEIDQIMQRLIRKVLTP